MDLYAADTPGGHSRLRLRSMYSDDPEDSLLFRVIAFILVFCILYFVFCIFFCMPAVYYLCGLFRSGVLFEVGFSRIEACPLVAVIDIRDT